MKKCLILYVFIIISIFITQCNKKRSNDIITYDLMNAPASLKQIADYERIFSKEEYNNLINMIKKIENKYIIKINIITAISFHGLTNEEIHQKRLYEIFNINHYLDKYIIFEFSKKKNRFAFSSSIKFNKKINKKRLNQKIVTISKTYFSKEKYYQGFKKMLEAIKEELQRNII